MKKKYVILIILGLVLAISGFFIYKGLYLYKYVLSEKRSNYLMMYQNGLKFDETIKVKTQKLEESEYVSVVNFKIRNDFKDFENKSSYDDENKWAFFKDNTKGTKTIFSMSKGVFDFSEVINSKEKWVQDKLKEKNINNEQDLILYMVNNKNNKPNIFSSKEEIEFYYYVYNLALISYPDFESIKIIDGDLKGFILETKDSIIREVHIIDGEDIYTLAFWNKEYFTYDYIEELLNTIVIEKENNEDCCKGCICGDTIELLKNTETAWTLTEINSRGEYVYKRSFINFHGIGKNEFAFFKYDENDNLISEKQGEFTINEKNEIILKPNDSKNNRTTCKIGEEKDLRAVMHCDNNFGTFTIQKQGTLELPSIITETISKTKSVKIKDHQPITEEKEINVLLSVINNSKVRTGPTTVPSPQYELELFDINNNSIAKILYNPGHYFCLEINDKNYNLTNIDKDLLNTILVK